MGLEENRPERKIDHRSTDSKYTVGLEENRPEIRIDRGSRA
jgi:hypothetical protein